jgi:hypothetical protein
MDAQSPRLGHWYGAVSSAHEGSCGQVYAQDFGGVEKANGSPASGWLPPLPLEPHATRGRTHARRGRRRGEAKEAKRRTDGCYPPGCVAPQRRM